MAHKIKWTDCGAAGVSCDQADGLNSEQILDAEEPAPCEVCGKMIKLFWDVHVEELPQKPAASGA